MSAPGRQTLRSPARTYFIWIAVLAVVPLLFLLQTHERLPAIVTTGLDPAVARLLETTLAELRAAPRSGEAWGKLGSVLMHYAFLDEARMAFERAEELSPADPRWPYLHGLMILNRDASAALLKLQRAVKCSGRDGPPRLRLAQTLAELGRTQEAEEQFMMLQRANLAPAPVSLGLARIRLAQGRPVESTNLLERCLSDPHTAKSAWAVLAAARQHLGDATGAHAASQRSAALPTDTPWPDLIWAGALAFRVGKQAQLETASAWLEQGRPAEALELLSAATRENPEDAEPWYLAGWTLNQLSRTTEAERALREHLRLEPQSVKGQAQLAVALLAQRRPSEAEAVLRNALGLKPTWRELHANLGYACVQLGREDEALRHYRQALALDPNHVPTCVALAELLLRRGQQDEALRLARQAAELSPDDARVQSLLRRVSER